MFYPSLTLTLFFLLFASSITHESHTFRVECYALFKNTTLVVVTSLFLKERKYILSLLPDANGAIGLARAR